ncbi:hypothetical protein [Clostridium sp.]
MDQTLKIKLSKSAHDELIKMIKESVDYTSIRFVYTSGCCKSAKVDIYLDNFKTGDIKNNIDDLKILYEDTLLDNISELTIAYTDSRFWVKTVSPQGSNKPCSKSNSESCTGCSGNCGSH